MNRQMTNIKIINGKRQKGPFQFFAVIACHRFVTKIGATRIANVVSGSRILVRTAIVTMGRPIPVTPLTKPPKQIAALIIAISSRLIPNTL